MRLTSLHPHFALESTHRFTFILRWTVRPSRRAAISSQNVRRARRCGTNLKVASHSVGAGFPPNRARSRAQPLRAPACHVLRTSVHSAPILKTDPLRESSDAGICDPDMDSPPGRTTGAGSARNHRFKLAAGDPAACIASSATPADQNGRRPHKGWRSRQTAGNPAVRFDPQPPRLTKTGCAPQGRCRRSTAQTEPPPATTASARTVPAPSARTKQGANRMTGVVTRDSAQRRPDRKHRSNASQFLTPQSERLAPPAADRLPSCRPPFPRTILWRRRDRAP